MAPHRDLSWIGAKLRSSNPYLGSLSVTASAVLFLLLLPEKTILWSASSILLMAVLTSATLWGYWPGLLTGLLSALCYDFFFIPPLYALNIDDWRDALSFLIFCLGSAAVSVLPKRAEEARVSAETEKFRSALLTSLSHDLKAPLSVIAGAADGLAELGPRLSEKAAQELVRSIQIEGERLIQQIANLLDMSQVDADAVRPKLQLTNLAEVIGSALLRVEPLLSRDRVTVDIPYEIPCLNLDPVLMEKAVYNILENAAFYTPPESPVTVKASKAPRSVILQIADEGLGICPADLPRVFETFYRGARSGPQPRGTGLGLSITRGFLETMGASVHASQRQDRSGTVFTINLPLILGKGHELSTGLHLAGADNGPK